MADQSSSNPHPDESGIDHPQHHPGIGLFQLMGLGLLAFTLLLVVIAVVVVAL